LLVVAVADMVVDLKLKLYFRSNTVAVAVLAGTELLA
jgi:hypothetical protein